MKQSLFYFMLNKFIFFVTRAGWLVTKIYQYYTFKQGKFEKGFVTTNKKSRQKATYTVERFLQAFK